MTDPKRKRRVTIEPVVPPRNPTPPRESREKKPKTINQRGGAANTTPARTTTRVSRGCRHGLK